MIYYLRLFAAACESGSFLGFPKWYKYLPQETKPLSTISRDFRGSTADTCVVQFNSLGDTWLVLAAVIEILLRISVLVALVFVVAGGAKFMATRGEPEKIAKARQTVINALIGLVISVSATGLVSFIAGRFN